MADVNWVVKHYSLLTVPEIYKILQLRNRVFIVELHCAVEEIDNEDLVEGSYHLMGLKHDLLVAYLRLNVSESEVDVRRVVVAKDFRGQGLARQLMLEALNWATEKGLLVMKLSARAHLERFYLSLGFNVTGPTRYVEKIQVGLVPMLKTLN